MKNQVSHEGHRQRLKNRFLSSSLEDFEPHNILELLLFYSIPRQDTNEIAHDLINNFGSLRGVFDADFDELIKIKGIKENSATLIKLIPQVAKAYLVDGITNNMVYDHADKIGEYLVNLFIGEKNEVVYVLLFDNSFHLLDTVRLCEGSVNSAMITPRKILDEVYRMKSSMFVIAHNHPNGLPIPSVEDIETTLMLSSAFDWFNVALLEHFVIAGDKYSAIIHDTGHGKRMNSPSLKY